MPSGLYDVRDRAEVLTPQEIEAGVAQCAAQGLQYIEIIPGEPVMPVAAFVDMLKARWTRAAQTAQLIDAIKAGYCSVSPKASPPSSDARH